jgi:hypothetical protein
VPINSRLGSNALRDRTFPMFNKSTNDKGRFKTMIFV